MTGLVAAGEVMLEISNSDSLAARVGIAGDTYNTAVYAARHGAQVSYFTQLGDDPYSDKILEALDNEGIGSSSIARLADRVPGLYMISNRDDGERSFHYWRDNSPAREMLSDERGIHEFNRAIVGAKMVYISGITLAILSEAALTALLDSLISFKKNGGVVAFDSNYRPKLWSSQELAKATIRRFMAISNIALLTDEDEQALWSCYTAEQIAHRHKDTDVRELIIKRGANDIVCFVRPRPSTDFEPPSFYKVPAVTHVVDTTAAGDSFNGAYLAERLKGSDVCIAVKEGCACAGRVIQYQGGIIPKDSNLCVSSTL